MIIKIIGHDGDIFKVPSETNPWVYFFKNLTTNGHSINNKINDPNFDVLIMNSYLNEKKIGLSKKNKNKIKKFLILWEPKQTNPKLYKKSHLAKFDQVYTPSKLWIETGDAHFFNWPQGEIESDLELETNWIKRKNKAIMICGNKYSVIKGELYSLRRSVINKTSQENVLDLAGVGWKQHRLRNIYSIIKSLIKSKLMHLTLNGLSNLNPKLINYIGPVSDKQFTQNKYKISLVIENTPDYISEKLFDALGSQNIVVYVGVDISKYELNRNMVLQIDDNAELISKTLGRLLNLDPKDQYKIMLEQQLEYRKIKGDWNNKKILSKLANSINAELTQRLK
jgi:hypothetical protein